MRGNRDLEILFFRQICKKYRVCILESVFPIYVMFKPVIRVIRTVPHTHVCRTFDLMANALTFEHSCYTICRFISFWPL